MPPQRINFADPHKILVAIHEQFGPIVAELRAEIVAARAEKIAVDAARGEKFDATKAREASGEKVDWCEWFRMPEHQLRYAYDLQALERELARIGDGWVEYDLTTLSGRDDLTESEKQVWRSAIRQLEADGLIQRDRRCIRLTPDGLERVKTLLAAKAER